MGHLPLLADTSVVFASLTVPWCVAEGARVLLFWWYLQVSQCHGVLQLEELEKRVKEQGEELATCHKKRAEIAEELAKSSQQMQVGVPYSSTISCLW